MSIAPQNPAAYPSAPRGIEPQSTLSRGDKDRFRHPQELVWLIIMIVLSGAYYLTVILIPIFWGAFSGIFADLAARYPELMEGSTGTDAPALDDMIAAAVYIVILLPLVIIAARALQYASLRMQSVRISPTQFPEAYRMIVEASENAGLRRVPDAYVVAGNGTINAFAAGHAYRRFIALYSDLFEVGGAARSPEALRFVIGHEVGHIGAGHVSLWRLIATAPMQQTGLAFVFSAALSRAQEYTADNFGHSLTPSGGVEAMKVLTAGKYLNSNVDGNEFADRAATERGFWVFLSNIVLSHPPLTWRMHALRDRSRPGSMFVPPKFRPALSTLPSGRDLTPSWPSPQQAMAFIDALPAPAGPQFGKNFPVPLPSAELQQPEASLYGQTYPLFAPGAPPKFANPGAYAPRHFTDLGPRALRYLRPELRAGQPGPVDPWGRPLAAAPSHPGNGGWVAPQQQPPAAPPADPGPAERTGDPERPDAPRDPGDPDRG